MPEQSRYLEGGFEPRFVVTRTDGKPCRPEARYIVLDGGGADPHAYWAIRLYACLLAGTHTPEEIFLSLARQMGEPGAPRGEADMGLALDLNRMLAGNWPPELAQHKDAQ